MSEREEIVWLNVEQTKDNTPPPIPQRPPPVPLKEETYPLWYYTLPAAVVFVLGCLVWIIYNAYS